MLTRHRVVVTGLGVLAPNGVGRDSFWETLLQGESGIGPVTLFDATDLPCRIAGEVKGFDPEQYIDPKFKPRKRMARAAQFAVAGTTMALADAGLDVDSLRAGSEVPVVMGVSTSAMDLFARPPTLWTAAASVPHAVGSAVAYTLGFDARLCTISDGCASGVDAIGTAMALIRDGHADIAIAGSSESSITHYVFSGFSKSRKLSTRNDEPHKASRPFDRDRDGGIISEGAGILVLENAEHAAARGAVVYSELTGFGTCADPAAGVIAEGLEQAIRRALDNACCPPEKIDHINAHAPSDEQMDKVETGLIKKVFGRQAYRIPVTSVKGVTGNAMAAAGVHQLIGTVLAVKEGRIPPTANLEKRDPDCDLDCVSGTCRRLDIAAALVNSHGFGRGNSCLVVEKV